VLPIGVEFQVQAAHWETTMTSIYVGNLPYTLTEDELRDAFAAYGEVTSAKIIIDRDTNRSKGFGFVEMPDSGSASEAIEAMNGQSLQGRDLRVNEARPREPRY
jgi:RNA recognition motif-containing protein